MVGTGIDYDVLKRAGAATADGFVAVTNGDNRNIMAALIAQRMFRIKSIVARIYDPPRGQMYRELGVQTVCPTTVGAKIIRDVLMEAPWNSLPIVRLRQAHFALGDRQRTPMPASASPISSSAGAMRIAAVGASTAASSSRTGDMVLEEGDEINAIVAPEAISGVRAALQQAPRPPRT